jgi:hypothetical protein
VRKQRLVKFEKKTFGTTFQFLGNGNSFFPGKKKRTQLQAFIIINCGEGRGGVAVFDMDDVGEVNSQVGKAFLFFLFLPVSCRV